MPAMDYNRVAHLYDTHVQMERDVPFFLKEVRQAQGPVLELTAGTGRVSLPLLRAGIDLTCLDSSVAMLEVFRKKLNAEAEDYRWVTPEEALALPVEHYTAVAIREYVKRRTIASGASQ
jgi:ubiquinone/menaquinone biosynthesis C-methylase UbiE